MRPWCLWCCFPLHQHPNWPGYHCRTPPPYIRWFFGRANLPWENIISLLRLCLDATFLSLRGNYNQQIFGTAMGLPVSVMVGNLVMEDIEQCALSTFTSPHVMLCLTGHRINWSNAKVLDSGQHYTIRGFIWSHGISIVKSILSTEGEVDFHQCTTLLTTTWSDLSFSTWQHNFFLILPCQTIVYPQLSFTTSTVPHQQLILTPHLLDSF